MLRTPRGRGSDCSNGTNTNASGRVVAIPMRRGRPSSARPMTVAVSPTNVPLMRAIIVPRWTPPTSKGAPTTTETPSQVPIWTSARPRPRCPPRRRRSPSLLEVSSAAAGASEDAFVDDEDVTGEHHYVWGTPFADVGDWIGVHLDLAARFAAEIDRILGSDPGEPTSARDGVDDRHVRVIGHLAGLRDLPKD